MNDEIIEVAISDIKTTGRRFRKDHGDVEALARLIEQGDLLQPIGVTDGLELVFGERRLRAYRDVLKRNTIPARFVNPASVELAQIDENVCRKDFTISEKVEIVDFLRGYRHGGNRKPGQEGNCAVELLTVDQAAKRAGLKNRDAYNRAKRVVQKGVPELVKAMDDEEISISAAADLASLDDELQRTLLAERTDWTANEITSMSGRTETTVAGNGDDAPTAEDSGEVGAEPEGEPGVPSEFVPVVGRGQDELDGTSADSTGESDGPLDNELDEPTEAEGGDPYNFYPTPPPVTEALLEVEDFGSQVWEPACGDGAISEALSKHGYEVASSDIVDRGYGEVEDFFESDRTAESIVTNPDYDYSEQFVRTALERTTHKVAMLLPLAFLSSRGRYDLLRSSPLKCVYVFTGRVSLHPPGQRRSRDNGRETFAWFVWEHGYEGSPTIHLFPPDVCEGLMKNDGDPPSPKHLARQVG